MDKDSMSPLCDFCNERTAVLYCRADSAKLCLFCDRQVHSANALALKHVRSQICDNCRSDSVTFRCTTDNLVLCSECDSDAHGSTTVASLHNRVRIHGFSGSPPPTELASVWGFVLNHNISKDKRSRLSRDSKVTNFHDLMLKSEHNQGASSQSVPCFEIPMMYNLENTSCGRHQSVIYKQLVDLAKRETVRLDGDVAVLGPVMPSQCCQPEILCNSTVELDYGDENEMVYQQQTPFTSLLMLDDPVEEAREDDGITEVNNPWTCNAPAQYQTPQIWDFCSGRARSCDEAKDKEVECDPNGFDSTMKNYSNTTKETPLTITDSFVHAYKVNSMSQYLNSPLQNGMDRRDGNHKVQKSKFIMLGSSSESMEMERASNPGNLQFSEHSQVDRDRVKLVAQNKGNAMVRYLEKKKARRFDKYIRYESRKARADTRKRVKGRFVKACMLDEKICN